jgi:hypothetical protein
MQGNSSPKWDGYLTQTKQPIREQLERETMSPDFLIQWSSDFWFLAGWTHPIPVGTQYLHARRPASGLSDANTVFFI